MLLIVSKAIAMISKEVLRYLFCLKCKKLGEEKSTFLADIQEDNGMSDLSI